MQGRSERFGGMKYHRSSNYRSLAWLIGERLTPLRVPYEFCPPDGDVVILADYGNTILVSMEWVKSAGLFGAKPRTYKILIAKADIVTGAVKLARSNGERIDADYVSAWKTEREVAV